MSNFYGPVRESRLLFSLRLAGLRHIYPRLLGPDYRRVTYRLSLSSDR